MFSIFVRNQKQEAPPAPPKKVSWLNSDLDLPSDPSPSSPEEQVELVCKTMEKLNQVKKMVSELPELPVGDRQEVLDRLSATASALSVLTFLDAIY